MAGAVSSRIRHLGVTTALSAIVLAVAVCIAGLASGGVAALGVGAGVVLVAVSYIATTLAVAWADSVVPRMVFGVGVGMYILKYSLFGLLLFGVLDESWAGRIPMAVGICIGVVVWTASQVWWMVHHAHPYVTTS